MTTFRNRYRVESTRLADWDYASRGWYFVTLCTQDKKCSLGRAVDGQIMLSDAGVIAETEMKAIPDHYVNVVIDRYVVMPNHVHAHRCD
jgi:REP element-mobilizing transposase RayT